MPAKKQSSSPDAIKAAYAAIVAYHNNLVQARFTITGLFLTANGLLAGGFFQAGMSQLPKFALPALGLALAAICWMLEIRTYQLLENLGKRGLDLEDRLGMQKDHGFFSLMDSQPIGPRLLPTRLRLRTSKLFSHSRGFVLLYTVIALFWVYLLVTTF
ncbi:MAG TPA: hypothetical protein VLS45_08510 [Methylomicrobium sp.]|nr:hypothetical protein [Methylomicrobium sp.]